jgi:hypothetical protein
MGTNSANKERETNAVGEEISNLEKTAEPTSGYATDPAATEAATMQGAVGNAATAETVAAPQAQEKDFEAALSILYKDPDVKAAMERAETKFTTGPLAAGVQELARDPSYQFLRRHEGPEMTADVGSSIVLPGFGAKTGFFADDRVSAIRAHADARRMVVDHTPGTFMESKSIQVRVNVEFQVQVGDQTFYLYRGTEETIDLHAGPGSEFQCPSLHLEFWDNRDGLYDLK